MSAAVFMRSGDAMREAMPQTVPSPRGNPCEFGDFDAFDLSLLPGPAFEVGGDSSCSSGSHCSPGSLGGSSPSWGHPSWGPPSSSPDCEVPYSPNSVGQLVSLFYDASPPPMFPSDREAVKPGKEGDDTLAAIKTEPLTEPAAEPLAEPLLGSCSSWENQSTAFLFSPGSSSPPYIKQEHPSPQQDASVPQMDEDRHDDADHQLLREVLKDTSFQRKFNLKPFDLGLGLGGLGGLAHQLQQPWAAPLRRTLSGGGGSSGTQVVVKMEQGDDGDLQQLDQDAIEPMISLAIQQMRNEIGSTCSMLGIAPDPALWTSEDVRAWVMWTLRQFSLPPVQLSLFDMEGSALAALGEADLMQRAPQSGSLLFAQLEIWKAACAEDMNCSRGASPVPTVLTTPAAPAAAAPAPAAAPSAAPSTGTVLMHHLEVPSLTPTPTPLSEQGACSPHSQFNSSASSADTSDDEDEDMETAAGAAPAAGSATTSTSSRGSHIHLWQFLKELLGAPQLHGSCVRWLDRPGGVFKIEDSVRVARLWGARKNRPAMNYDKLSRSIRQYYKKGIMKKTERSQRLVYQFCHPYSL